MALSRHQQNATAGILTETPDTGRPALGGPGGRPADGQAADARPRRAPMADVEIARERRRRRRVALLGGTAAVLAGWVLVRLAMHRSLLPFTWPSVDPLYLMSGLFFAGMLLVLVMSSVVTSRSPHIVFRPDQIDVRFDDVVGMPAVTDEVRRSVELFRSASTFRHRMGGSPRRGLLFEGPPGTGKTHMAKAMAAEAGVPFLYVSATSFESMYYGATARKIRSYFAALRRAARAEGGAIGFIEEIDAIGGRRGGMAASPAPGGLAAGGLAAGMSQIVACGGLTGLPGAGGRVLAGATGLHGAGSLGGVQVHAAGTAEGTGGVVNELLVQLQSFDTPTWSERALGAGVDAINRLRPSGRRLPRPRSTPGEIMIIAATNRADSLDPALLRPGRFDRRLSFDVPDQGGRRELVDHFLARKSHEPDLASDERRDALAGVTQGYSPVMIENLLDEALVNALRRGADGMNWADLEHARLVTEIGLGHPVTYTEHEQRLIATHEAGHAVVAWLEAPHRRLEILTIVKRAGALGLLAHGDAEDVYTRSRSELSALIRIAFGGQVAEELFFGDVSTGPGSDLAYATTVAAQMVGAAGMAGTLVSFSAVHGSALSSSNLAGQVVGDADGRRMVEELLERQRDTVRELLGAHRHLVEALRDALLERHELIGREITDVLEAARDTAARAAAAPGAAAGEASGPDAR